MFPDETEPTSEFKPFYRRRHVWYTLCSFLFGALLLGIRFPSMIPSFVMPFVGLIVMLARADEVHVRAQRDRERLAMLETQRQFTEAYLDTLGTQSSLLTRQFTETYKVVQAITSSPETSLSSDAATTRVTNGTSDHDTRSSCEFN